jgi:hypothetical protein
VSNQKHTPGPWASSGVGVVRANTGELICNALYDDGEEYPNAEANTRLIAAAPTQNRVLEMVYDSPTEPDKWYQDVRFALQKADGVERPGKTAFQRRDELRVQRAAEDLLKAAELTVLCFKRSDASGDFLGDDEYEAWTALNKAIAKATGGSCE